jgi:leader peptidase (prepilin peptidase)/N-methyltransferase
MNSLIEFYMLTLLFIFGASIGSFLNVVIYRVPEKMNIVFPGSHCFSCKNPVRFFDNIPIISYFITKGSCRNCSTPFSIRYVIVEFLTAVLTVILFLIYGFNTEFYSYLFLTYMLIAITFIDIDHFIIPNGFIILGLVVVPALLMLGWLPIEAVQSAMGALFFSAFLFALGILGRFIFKKEAMGLGDVKLGIILGGFLGVKTTILTLYLSFIIAGAVTVVGLLGKWIDRKTKIPFGPYLACGTIISILTRASSNENLIINWYISLIG